jgi:pimeloyl-ACP methyl ester carboxylesterase
MRAAQQVGVLAADGRRLDAQVAGPEDGPAVLFHFGTPAAGILSPQMIETGAELGVRHVTYSRPGYGRSDRRPGRTVADCAEDVAAVMDALGIARFHTVGWSGGGPHAIACAALLPERTVGAATIAGVAPFTAEGLDFLAGMGPENHEEFGAAADPGQLEAYLRGQAEGMRDASAADVHASLGELLSPVDRQTASGEFAEHLASLFRAALETDVWGWFDDDLAFVADWGFDPGAVQRPVTVWQGSEDRMVPLAHGRWLAEHVGGARARLLDGEGHLSLLLGRYRELLEDLLGAC